MDHHEDPTLARHEACHATLSDCPLVPGNEVHVLRSAQDAIGAMFDAIGAARHHLHLEYYILDDVALDGRRLSETLREALARGVEVAIVYDSVGSHRTPDALFDRLERAGAKILEFRPINPLHRHFAWHLNDRDHRKLMVADGQTAFLGGVNLSRVYENPRSSGVLPDAAKSYWHDCAVRLRGPIVGWAQRIFLENWAAQGGEALPDRQYFPPPPAETAPRDTAHKVRIEASAPLEKRRLYFTALRAAIAAARQRILLTTGYFVPSRRDWQALADAAGRGVDVDLVLSSVSDIRGTLHAARALYGRLLEAGVRIHEVQDGYLHAKAATIDGVWSSIGSSNFDRRSYAFNNELDAVLLGHDAADAIETLLRDWMRRSELVTLPGWRQRSLHERAAEYTARLWERYM